MPPSEHAIVLWSVAGRFGFSESEIRHMPLSRLRFWYKGHQRMVADERASLGIKDE